MYFYGNRKGQVKFSTSEAGADLLLDDDLLRIFDYFVLYGKRLVVKLFDLEERGKMLIFFDKNPNISVNSLISAEYLMKSWLPENTEFGLIPKPID